MQDSSNLKKIKYRGNAISVKFKEFGSPQHCSNSGILFRQNLPVHNYGIHSRKQIITIFTEPYQLFTGLFDKIVLATAFCIKLLSLKGTGSQFDSSR